MGWVTSDGEAVKSQVEYEASGGSMDPMPDGTTVIALIDEAGQENRNEVNYVSLRWSVVEPAQYRNRKIFQKLYVADYEPNALKKGEAEAKKKRDKAIRMLGAIDANAGGELISSGNAPEDLTTQQLQGALMEKPMFLRLGAYDMPRDDGGRNQGNYIQAVAPVAKYHETFGSTEQAKPTAPKTATLNDDVPF